MSEPFETDGEVTGDDGPKRGKPSATLVGAWVAVVAGASGRVFDLMPGGCADGIGCIFSVGMITSWLAFPVVVVLGALTIAFSLAVERPPSQSRWRWHTVGAVAAMVVSGLVVAADWLYPYWPRY